ncbi:hypothetical protein Dimus_007797 [Dionaea muscipula]
MSLFCRIRSLLHFLYEYYRSFEVPPSQTPKPQASQGSGSTSTFSSSTTSSSTSRGTKKLWHIVIDKNAHVALAERSELDKYFADDLEVTEKTLIYSPIRRH